MTRTYYQLSKTTPHHGEHENLGTLKLHGQQPHRAIEQELKRTGILAQNAGFTIGPTTHSSGFIVLGENNTLFTLTPGGSQADLIPDNTYAAAPLITKARHRPFRTLALRAFNALFPTNYP